MINLKPGYRIEENPSASFGQRFTLYGPGDVKLTQTQTEAKMMEAVKVRLLLQNSTDSIRRDFIAGRITEQQAILALTKESNARNSFGMESFPREKIAEWKKSFTNGRARAIEEINNKLMNVGISLKGGIGQYKGYTITDVGGNHVVHKNGELQHGMGGPNLDNIKSKIDMKVQNSGIKGIEVRQVADGYACYKDGKIVYESPSKVNCEKYAQNPSAFQNSPNTDDCSKFRKDTETCSSGCMKAQPSVSPGGQCSFQGHQPDCPCYK